MMNKISLAFSVCLLATLFACSEKHLINNREYLLKVDSAFAERKQLAGNRSEQLFSFPEEKLSQRHLEAFRFLVAFSPLNDLAEFNADFFHANAAFAFKSREETPWGKNIPEEIFLHYVLPPRVNNENLDSFRILYYQELKTRINGLDAESAALEINHWCHEKVSYQPSDIRTSGPMSTMLSARGRCGEESTFTVAALRTAGIPARQVYTPRWAHSDDNHAWVEVWINGKWYYMGACEPEPVLDRGWFTEPARRAMLIHTKSFGASTGNENFIVSARNYSEVNNLSKYASTKEIFVKVSDSNNVPADNAIVEYQLYNYAEFFPLAMVPTDKNGLSRFETGLGDLLIWARKNNEFNFRHISVNEIDTISIKLEREAAGNDSYIMDLGVPVARTPLKGPNDNLIAANNRRVAEGNKIRQQYIGSWIGLNEARILAEKIDADSGTVINLISKSMGNYKEITAFLENTHPSQISLAIDLLSVIADKDLRDTPARVLIDHISNSGAAPDSKKTYPSGLFKDYVLNPRVANEILSPWRGYLLEKLPANIKSSGIANPEIISRYLEENVKLADNENYYKTPITPKGVLELGVSDSFSRDICFVAICRSLGIPSRLEPGSNLPQYYTEEKWHDAIFSDRIGQSSGKGFIKLLSEEKNPVPEYYTHFTIARFENGRYNTLDFDYNRRITEFKEELPLAPGHYMIVTGNRINDSKILSAISFFTLSENDHKQINIEIRKDISPVEILGQIDKSESIYLPGDIEIEIDTLIKGGAVFFWIEPDSEPTKHVFNDLPLLKRELDNWGGNFVFLSDGVDNTKGQQLSLLEGLPEKSIFAVDKGSILLGKVRNKAPLSEVSLPYIILADKNGNIIFRSEGYRIGIGEQILKKVR